MRVKIPVEVYQQQQHLFGQFRYGVELAAADIVCSFAEAPHPDIYATSFVASSELINV
jgi:hypothetical protein